MLGNAAASKRRKSKRLSASVVEGETPPTSDPLLTVGLPFAAGVAIAAGESDVVTKLARATSEVLKNTKNFVAISRNVCAAYELFRRR